MSITRIIVTFFNCFTYLFWYLGLYINFTKYLLKFSIKFSVNSWKFASLCVGYMSMCGRQNKAVFVATVLEWPIIWHQQMQRRAFNVSGKVNAISNWHHDRFVVRLSADSFETLHLSVSVKPWLLAQCQIEQVCSTTRAARHVNSGCINLHLMEFWP